MAPEQDGRIALLPIQPQYVRAVIDGEKRVEFRRRRFAAPVKYVVVYATAPIRRIVAFFRVSHIAEATPARLWAKYNGVGGIQKDAFQAYYKGVKRGIAIEIGEVVVLDKPLPLRKVSPHLSAPQSFAYLSPRLFERIRGETRSNTNSIADGLAIDSKLPGLSPTSRVA